MLMYVYSDSDAYVCVFRFSCSCVSSQADAHVSAMVIVLKQNYTNMALLVHIILCT